MFVYKTTNLINGKIYVGRHRGNSEKYIGSGKVFSKAIKKYGRENFKREILEYCDDKIHLKQREIYWIAFYNANNKDIGYNITKGGDDSDAFDSHPDREAIMERRKASLHKYLLTPEAKLQRSINSKKMWQDPVYIQNQKDKQKISQNRPETKRKKSVNGKIAQSTEEIVNRKSSDLKNRWKNNPEYVAKTIAALKEYNSDPENLKKRMSGIVKWWEDAVEVQCPHCEMKSKSVMCMNRWHFDNCKHKK